MNYMEYYKKCVYADKQPQQVDRFTYKVLPKINISGVHEILFKDILNYPEEDWIIRVPYKQEFKNCIINLFEQVKSEFDKIFCSPFFLETCYIYRSVPFDKRTSSAIYHFDNTPQTMLKCIVYLNDVLSDDDGPIEFCDNLIIEPTRQGPNHWFAPKNNSRLTDDEVSAYKKVKIYAEAGTPTIFYPSCIHRANPPAVGKIRDVVNFIVRPTPNPDELYQHIKGFEKSGTPLMNPADRYK